MWLYRPTFVSRLNACRHRRASRLPCSRYDEEGDEKSTGDGKPLFRSSVSSPHCGDERLRLLNACRESDHPYLELIVILALSTGARKGEILNLRWPDVDLHRGIAILHDTKNGDRRSLSITGMALEKLKDFSKVRRLDTELLFPRSDGKKPQIFDKPWLVALQKADIHDFRFHDLRHTAASYLAMNGASLLEIASDMLTCRTGMFAALSSV